MFSIVYISGFILVLVYILGTQWVSGRVLDLSPRGHWFKPHCIVSLSKTCIIPCLVLVQPWKTCLDITEIFLTGMYWFQKNLYDTAHYELH